MVMFLPYHAVSHKLYIICWARFFHRWVQVREEQMSSWPWTTASPHAAESVCSGLHLRMLPLSCISSGRLEVNWPVHCWWSVLFLFFCNTLISRLTSVRVRLIYVLVYDTFCHTFSPPTPQLFAFLRSAWCEVIEGSQLASLFWSFSGSLSLGLLAPLEKLSMRQSQESVSQNSLQAKSIQLISLTFIDVLLAQQLL